MAINKVVFGTNTLIDISDTTATAADVAYGKYFYTADGVRTMGTAEGTDPTPSETWEVIFDDTISWYPDDNNSYPYCWLSTLADVQIQAGSVWRLTYNGVQYRCTAKQDGAYAVIGNPKYSDGGTDDGSDVPVVFANYGWGAWTGSIDLPNNEIATTYFKIERLVSA